MRQEAIQLSVVIPAYNEAGRIGRSLERLSAYLQGQYKAGGFEIIVVDDGSRDATIRVVEQIREHAPACEPPTFPP